jgi:malate dehydrogenase (oxaloacetate-decarboxylating)
MPDYYQQSLELHKQKRGKIAITTTVPIENREDLSVAYTPGVAEPSRLIGQKKLDPREVVASKNMVAVITDGSAVLGLGDIGPEAALPVMEGKAALFKRFADINAFPIAVATQDVDEFVRTVELIAPTFGGINLEDISAPRCFEIEQSLIKLLPIPVFHDDQHGTAIVVVAGLLNALKIVRKDIGQVRVVINGAGAAGVAIAKLLQAVGVAHQIMADSKGIIVKGREELTPVKEELLQFTNKEGRQGALAAALEGADVFIGVSKGNLLTEADVRTMAPQPIIFAMANPEPEIMPEAALAGGAAVVATGRSDFPNQLNNVLAFPGVFKGAFQADARVITDDMKIAAAHALADLVATPTPEKIIPSPFDDDVADAVAKAVADAA